MQIKKIRAKNFLSIGPEGIEIDFTKLSNVVVIKGRNFDIGPNASNAAGKTVISSEILLYAFYGKLLKGVSHKEVIHKKVKKGCEVEVEWDNYRIVRTRKPDALYLYEDGKDISLGGMPSTQAEIESRIKLNYDTFVNVVCFGEHNNHSFLTCDAATKRNIVENLLGLEKYIKYVKVAKEKKSELESRQTSLIRAYEGFMASKQAILAQLHSIASQERTWQTNKEAELERLKTYLAKYQEDLKKTDDGSALLQYEEAQKTILQCNQKISSYETSRANLSENLSNAQRIYVAQTTQRNEFLMQIKENNLAIREVNNEIFKLRNENNHLNELHTEVKCSRCYGIINKENYQEIIASNNAKIEELLGKLEAISVTELHENVKALDAKMDDLNKKRANAEEKVKYCTSQIQSHRAALDKASRIRKPEVETQSLLLYQRIDEAESQIKSKQEELRNNPFKELIISNKAEIKRVEGDMVSIKAELNKVERKIPYYDYWVKGFGDNGIRSFIIESILPTLNSRINYWLQFLIDNKINVQFDKQFDTLLERNPADGDPFVYNATSGGERRRINLAISQAFAYVMMLSCQQCPSLISLDEVSLNVDVPGVLGIYKMICELARERQVLVTTHDSYLLDLLSTCKEIVIEKKDGFSKLAA